MKINAIIIDDEPLAIDVLISYAGTIDYLHIMATFTNPVEAIRFLTEHNVDLVFLDIEMPFISGIDLVDSLNTKPDVIFTTAFPQYAVDGFNLDAIDYLLKPVSYKRFLKAVNKISKKEEFQEQQNSKTENFHHGFDHRFIFVKSDYENLKVNINEIKFIEGLKDYLRINLANGKFVLTLSNFNTLLEKIASDDFMRVHNSYVVNINYVKSIQKNRVIIDDKRIPISETYKKPFFDKIGLH